jgi:hypothetical protein
MLSATYKPLKLSVFMLNVIMLSVIMLSVMAPTQHHEYDAARINEKKWNKKYLKSIGWNANEDRRKSLDWHQGDLCYKTFFTDVMGF